MAKVAGAFSLTFALLSVFVGWAIAFYSGIPFIDLILPILAIILGIVGLIVDSSKGPATAGLIIGIIMLVVGILFWLLILPILVILGIVLPA